MAKAWWMETGNATAAEASATHTASTGEAHRITHASGSYDSSGQSGTLTLTSGSDTLYETDVHGDFHVEFPAELTGNEGDNVKAALSAGSSGVVGRVNLGGYSA